MVRTCQHFILELSFKWIGWCQIFATGFYGITENKKSDSEHLTQTKQRKTLKKNLIYAILNTVAQAANFDTIGGNYYVQI